MEPDEEPLRAYFTTPDGITVCSGPHQQIGWKVRRADTGKVFQVAALEWEKDLSGNEVRGGHYFGLRLDPITDKPTQAKPTRRSRRT